MSQIRGLYGGSASDVVYFETQAQGRLCGLHCLNNLLQGPYYQTQDVAAVGMRLDMEERRLTQGQQLDANYSNVSHDGFFSVSVIEQSLAQRNFVMIPFGNPRVADLRAEPARHKDAFICNLREHWFAIRCVKGRYFRLDSLKPGPEPVSNANLRDFLDSLTNRAYSVFVIRSQNWPNTKLPEPSPQEFGRSVVTQAQQPISGGGAYMTFDVAARLNELADSQPELRESASAQPQEKISYAWPEGTGQTVRGATGQAQAQTAEMQSDVGADPEILQVLLQSAAEFRQTLPDPPKEDGSGVNIQIIDVHNKQHRRRFPRGSVVGDMFLWIHKDSQIMSTAIPALAARVELTLTAQYPRRLYVRRYVGGRLQVSLNDTQVQDRPIDEEFPEGETLRLQMSD